jgi:hypothetical protein
MLDLEQSIYQEAESCSRRAALGPNGYDWIQGTWDPYGVR